MRHVGTYGGNKVWVLGYEPELRKVLVLDPNTITQSEAESISDTISSSVAQSRMYVLPVFNLEIHPDNEQINMVDFLVKKSEKVPMHTVELSDKAQCEHWIGSSSAYNPDIGDLKVRVSMTESQSLPEAPVHIPAELSSREIPDFNDFVIDDLVTEEPNQAQDSPIVEGVRQGIPDKTPDLLTELHQAVSDLVGLRKTVVSIDKAVRTMSKRVDKLTKSLEDDAKV